jgi:fibronectin type 3 domain-containing protein
LQAQGFVIGSVPAGRGRVPFSGTAAQVQAAFGTPIHYFTVAGTRHFANTANPQIPASFAPLIGGIRGLHDFHPKSSARVRAPESSPAFTEGGGHFVGPADFATIYNLAPLYQDQVFGAGVTIAIASQSDIDPATPTAYWSAFGIAPAQPVTYMISGTDPGKTSSETETDLDVEIAGALAPAAQLIVVTASDAVSAAAYAINMNLAPIISSSYGACENALGTAGNLSVSSDYEQASAEGITVIVATGDQGSAGCDSSAESVDGLAVNGLASTPYDVAVGGTDFNQSLEAAGNYWNSTDAPGTLASALSYIPETTWNSSCAALRNPLTACNARANSGELNIQAASGGLSSAAVASGAGSVGYAQPAWQSGLGIASFGARALPDISLQASDWAACVGAPGNCAPASGQFTIAGGTSVAAPAFAAIVALLDQTQISSSSVDGRQGLINPQLYQLAASEYGSNSQPNDANLAACNSGMGAAVGSGCFFYDITVGNNAVPCNAANYVGEPAGTEPRATCATADSADQYGVLELNSAPAYTSGAGYDLATGLGSINAANLVLAIGQDDAPTGLTASLSGGTATLRWNANPKAPAGTTYNLYQGSAPGGESTTPVRSGLTATTTTVTGLTSAGQSYYFRVAAVSGGTVSNFFSNEASVSVVPAAPGNVIMAPSGAGFTVSWAASVGANSYSVYLSAVSGGETAPALSNIVGTSQFFSATAGSTYYATVVAVDAGGASKQSAEVSITIAPAPPAGLAASAGAASVALSWMPTNGAQSYGVYEGTVPGGEGSVPIQTVGGNAALIGGLLSGQTYYFTVTASNAGGASAPSGEVSAQLLPPAPSAVSAAGGAKAATVTWMPSVSALYYDVYLATRSGAEGATPFATNIVGNSYNATGLIPGTTYFFTVQAVNAAGASATSSEVSATVLPAQPTGAAASAGNGSVTLTWSAVPGAVSYQVFEGTAPGAEAAAPVQSGVTATSVTVSGLTNGQTYYLYVEAVDAGGSSSPSAQVSATPQAPPSSGGGSLGIMDLWAAAALALLGARARARPNELAHRP